MKRLVVKAGINMESDEKNITEPKKALSAWCSEMKTYSTPSWDSLPDLDLYMDQVITYLERHLRLFEHGEEDKLITPAMINNYVKNDIIPRPDRKKYSKVHLAYLLAITLLKQVLPIPDISGIISEQAGNMEMSDLFDKFRKMQDEAFHAAAARVDDAILKNGGDNAKEELGMLAMELTFEANAVILAAKRIIHAFSTIRPLEEEDRKKKQEAPSADQKKKKIEAASQEHKKKRIEAMPQEHKKKRPTDDVLQDEKHRTKASQP